MIKLVRFLRLACIGLLFQLTSCVVRDEVVLPTGKIPSKVSGYTDKVSYHAGEFAKVFINADENNDFGLYRLFDANGIIVSYASAPLTKQSITNVEPWANGLGYQESFTYQIPVSLKSGLYFWEQTIPFVIKSASATNITVVYCSNTINAYTQTANRSLYTPNTPMVSFQRPMELKHSFSLEFYQWLAKTDINYRVIADVDLDDPADFFDSDIIIIAGHSEYWTRSGRENFDAFVDGGKHAIILSGNTMWWQVRYEEDKLVCYRSKTLDPISNPKLETYLWNDPLLEYPIIKSIGGDFDNGGYGLRADSGWDGYKITTSTSPLLEGTSLVDRNILSLPTDEYDGVPLKGFDNNGFPIANNDVLGFNKIELIGYDLGFRVHQTVGTFFLFRKTVNSGIVINAGSMNWCSDKGIGASNGIVKRITSNMIKKLQNGQPVFSH